jgi:aspartate-semialdehyde dehydrogenase
MHSHGRKAKSIVAIVGAESLLGKEIREVIEASKLDVAVKLIGPTDAEEASILTRGRDEPLVMTSLQAADLSNARVVVLAGSLESNRKAYEHVKRTSSKTLVIDANGGLEDDPETRIRAPILEPPGYAPGGAIQAIAHPAAIALALFLIHLQKAAPIRRVVAEIFEPASERGQAGLDELQKQTAGLLSFKPLPKEVFDAQVSFNMLPQFGSDSIHSLDEIELRISRHLASLLAAAGSAPIPSLRVIQAPVFHGYSISSWVEFENRPDHPAIARALASEGIDVRTKNVEAPTNVGVAGQSGITVGAIVPDRNDLKAGWFWIVADNLRIVADNALEVARAALE